MQFYATGSTSSSVAYGVSADGRHAVGFAVGGPRDSIEEAVRWSPEIAWLGQLSLDHNQGGAYRTSADGSVVVGASDVFGQFSEAFRWREGVMLGLGFLGPDTFDVGFPKSIARDVSPDGVIVVGGSSRASVSEYEAFRWTELDGFTALGDLPGGAHWSEATGVSADGSVIVGNSAGVNNPGPENGDGFIWDAEHGIQELRTLLIQDGVDLGGWTRLEIFDVSADGKTIVGTAHDANLQISQAFVAYVPEPPTVMLLCVGVLGARCLRSRTEA
jgi:probable HAF family extracellular repeat protein